MPKAVQIIHSLASNHLIFESVRNFRADSIARFLQIFVLTFGFYVPSLVTVPLKLIVKFSSSI